MSELKNRADQSQHPKYTFPLMLQHEKNSEKNVPKHDGELLVGLLDINTIDSQLDEKPTPSKNTPGQE